MKHKKEMSFPHHCWHCILLAVILLFCAQVVCAVIGGVLYWDCFKEIVK